jgi:DNA-binding SARP family transcriptional activator
MRLPPSSERGPPADPLPNGYRGAAVTQFGILGPVEARRDGVEVRLGGRNQRAVLALLLLQAGRVVSIERIAGELYGEEAPVTAVTQVHRQVSELRKALDASVIETRPPGYLARVGPDDLDLSRFEVLTERGAGALAGGDPGLARDLLREALGLWRGPALADLADEQFAQRPIARLEELRIAALEHRLEADLRLGGDSDLVPELRELAEAHPLREQLREMLMVALYRAGRQVEALDVYRDARRELIDSFGLEPGPGLRDLEQAILRHDPALAPPDRALAWRADPTAGTVLVAAWGAGRLGALLPPAVELARHPRRELIVALLVPDEPALGAATAELARLRETLGAGARTAAFVSARPGDDLARLVRSHEPDLVLLDAPPGFADGVDLEPELTRALAGSPCDVAIVSGPPADESAGSGVVVPFAGSEHDWAAAELGAWLAAATRERLLLAGARADPRSGGRDASRLLADASLAVQRTAGIAAEPFLVDPGADGLLEAAAAGGAVVLGVSPRWAREGLGDARRAVVAGAGCPVLVVHRGPRPGGLAPKASATRFTWSLGS